MVASLDYKGIGFPVSKKSYQKIEPENNISINDFKYEIKQVYPINI